MPIVPGLTSGRRALFGGCGLGAAIEVMEQVTGRPCVWATAQYLTYASPPSVLELDAFEVVRGHHISQARVHRARRRHRGAHGPRRARRPAAARRRAVGAATRRAAAGRVSASASTTTTWTTPSARRLEERLAAGRPFWDLPGPQGSGNSAIWVRLPDVLEMSAAALAIIGDFVPSGIGQAFGRRAGGNSLDNTLRVAHRVPDRLGARRHPRARGRRRLRTRPRPPLGRGRHAARVPRASRRSCAPGATNRIRPDQASAEERVEG